MQKRGTAERILPAAVHGPQRFDKIRGVLVIGEKVVEINAESPGGMQSVERLYDIDVCPTIIDALEGRTGLRS